MKAILVIITVMFSAIALNAQEEKPHIYDPSADAKADIQKAVAQAKIEGKHVLLQIGGNWCPWCIKFHKFVHEDPQVDSIIKASYIFQLVNYSKENKNPDILADLGYPQRFGFPVLVILDGNGNRLHTQNSAYLEQEKAYSMETVIEFLKQWTPAALDPENYK
jgi:thioredoxin-related protein